MKELVLNPDVYPLGCSAISIVLGVVFKNTGDQLSGKTSPLSMIGMILFMAGWVGVAYYLSKMSNDKFKFIAPVLSGIIVMSVMVMVILRDRPGTVTNTPMSPWFILALFGFVASWILLGLYIGHHDKNYGGGLLIPLFMLSSTIISLPIQRKRCMVDGPGLILFSLGWILVVGLATRVKDDNQGEIYNCGIPGI